MTIKTITDQIAIARMIQIVEQTSIILGIHYMCRATGLQNTAFLDLDQSFYESVKDEDPPHSSGSTLLAALLVGKDLWLANAGDSRAVISCKGKAEDLTEDHRPGSTKELVRVKAAGIFKAWTPEMSRSTAALGLR